MVLSLSPQNVLLINLKNKEVNKFFQSRLTNCNNLYIIWSYLYLPSIQPYLKSVYCLGISMSL